MTDDSLKPQEDGFEYRGTFYRWHVSDVGKDLMLIDKFAGLPVTEFFELVDDEHERTRGPILLGLIATSVRNGHPDWSVERITRLVMDLNLSDVEFLSSDDDDDDEAAVLPPSEPETSSPTGAGSSSSPLNGSSLSSTPPASSTSETLPVTRL